MPESGTKSLGDVLSSGVYRIPNYQRGYAWTPREVNDFIDDLEYVTDNDGVKSHYVNSVIVTQPENESLVDGLYVDMRDRFDAAVHPKPSGPFHTERPGRAAVCVSLVPMVDAGPAITVALGSRRRRSEPSRR